MSIPKGLAWISKQLESIDFYAQPISLLQNQATQYSTSIGQYASLIIYIAALVQFLYLTLDLFQFKNPYILDTQTSSLDPERFDLNHENFFIAVAITDFEQNIVQYTQEDTIFEAVLKLCSQRLTQNEEGQLEPSNTCISMNMIQCSADDQNQELIEVEFQHQYRHLEKIRFCFLQVFVLIELNGRKTQLVATFKVLLTQLISSLYELISIGVKTQQLNQVFYCAPQAEIEKRTNGGILQLSFTDNLLDQRKPGNPYNHVIKQNTLFYDDKQTNYIKYLLRHSLLTDHVSMLPLFTSETTYRALQTYDALYGTTRYSYQNLFYVYFLLDDRIDNYYRTYDTILNVLANIGVFIKGAAFLLGIVILPLAQFAQLLDISQFIKSAANLFWQSSIRVKRNQQLKDGLFKNVDPAQNLGFYNYLFKSSRFEKEQTRKEICRLKVSLEIGQILTILQELETLKLLTLSQKQLQLFKCIKRPTTPMLFKQTKHRPSSTVLPSEDVSDTSSNDEQNLELDRIKKAYKELIVSKQPNDQHLLMLLDPCIKHFLDQEQTHGFDYHPNPIQSELQTVLKLSITNLRKD